MLAAALAVALVVDHQAALRAAPHDNAPKQTMLVPGDWLEVRGERQGYLEVYDHRLERPGYVRPAAVRAYDLDPAAAPRLLPVVDYLKDAAGEESLGIGYVALYLSAASAESVGAEVFDALGTMAERLGQRASVHVARAGDATLAAELAVAESYGAHFVSFERDGATRVCYDGEAYRRVLALGGTGPARVRAALGLTDPACLDPARGATAALALATWQSEVLGSVDPSKLGAEVPASTLARLRLRRAIVKTELAYLSARAGGAELAEQASLAAQHELFLVDRAVIADDDRLGYDEAALRVATVRWAREAPAPRGASGLSVEIAAGEPGQTCVRVRAAAGAPTAAPFEHCTYGLVWPSSVRVAPNDAAVAMVVEPLDGWNELLVLRPSGSAAAPAPATWMAETMPPALFDPDIGYVELLGFSPDAAHLLVARELRASGPLGAPHTLAPWVKRTFQVVATSDLHVENEASSLGGLPKTKRWETVEWRRGTLALR